MFARFSLALILAATLSACSSVSDRYAFWRDDAPASDASSKPNLGNVPTPPNVTDTKAEMENMRQRLEAERQNAYLASQGVVPTSSAPANSSDGWGPDASPAPEEKPAAPTYQPMPVPGQQGIVNGNVVYNYSTTSSTANQPYTYGFSPVNIRATGQNAPMNDIPSDPSITVDLSTLGLNHVSNAALDAMAANGQPVIFFKYGSSRLGAADIQKLRDLAQQINSGQQSAVIIGLASKPTGLKDSATADEVNLKMSAKRAAVVLRELVKQGVSADKLNVTAFGDTLAKGNPAQDQRVDVKFNY